MYEFECFPIDVDNMTFDQLDSIFNQLNKYRKHTPRADVTLETIRVVLFKWMGIKVSDTSNIKQFGDFPTMKVTKEEKEAWVKAKMPSPIGKFIAKYRKDHNAKS